jgi:hypothetical protein
MPLNPDTLKFIFAIIRKEEIQPIKVSKLPQGQFVVKDGRHRLAAFKILGLTSIPATFSNKCLTNKTITIMKKVDFRVKSNINCCICGNQLKANAVMKGHDTCNKCYMSIKAIEQDNPSETEVEVMGKHMEKNPHLASKILNC